MRSIRQKVLGWGDFFKSPPGLCALVGSIQPLYAPQGILSPQRYHACRSGNRGYGRAYGGSFLWLPCQLCGIHCPFGKGAGKGHVPDGAPGSAFANGRIRPRIISRRSRSCSLFGGESQRPNKIQPETASSPAFLVPGLSLPLYPGGVAQAFYPQQKQRT